jgi:hypothetical protein
MTKEIAQKPDAPLSTGINLDSSFFRPVEAKSGVYKLYYLE